MNGTWVSAFTGVWVALLGGLLIKGLSNSTRPFSIGTYQCARVIGTLVILGLTSWALKRAFGFIGKATPPWYSDSFLVSMVVFWALFPPAWFFVEYTLFEHGQIALVSGEVCMPHCHSDFCNAELARLDTYAGFASKIWAGMGATLAGVIALSRGKELG
jgi:hypothetical protein